MKKKINYEALFHPLNQHPITIRNRLTGIAYKKTVYNNRHVEKLLRNQCDNCDIYIAKYPINYPISMIILDFDSEEDKEEARADAIKLKKRMECYGLNTVIVDSGKKGYHTYIQTPPHPFHDCEFLQVASGDYNLRFMLYVDALINTAEYETLDLNNHRAGLRSNIRLIGSTHPVSLNDCRIVDGEFNYEEFAPVEEDYTAYRYAFYKANKIEKKQPHKPYRIATVSDNPIQSNDLRELMPCLFGGSVLEFKDYVMMQCPFHDDKHPSMVVTKEYYYCKSCNSKGNWWTLKKHGYVDFKYKDADLTEVL